MRVDWTPVASKPAAATVFWVSRFRRQLPATLRWSGVSRVLPLRKASLSADVLEKDEAPAGLQHPSDLGQRDAGVLDGAEDERDDRSVEARIGEWQRLCRARDDLDRN